MAVFLIKVLSSSMPEFIHPRGGQPHPKEGTELCRHPDIHNRMHWRFQRVEGDFGYIIHNTSGMCVVPEFRSKPMDEQRTLLVLSYSQTPAALFKFDLSKNEIVYRDGQYAATGTETHSDFINVESKPKFECVSVNDPNQRINPYEKT